MKSNLNIVEQVELLKNRVVLTHPDFIGFQGMIVSIRVNGNYYWVLLDFPYKNKNKENRYTRLRMFNEKYIEII